MPAKEKKSTISTLAGFSVERSQDGYLVHIEDGHGQKLDLLATEETLDLIADAIDDILDEDDAGEGDGQ